MPLHSKPCLVPENLFFMSLASIQVYAIPPPPASSSLYHIFNGISIHPFFIIMVILFIFIFIFKLFCVAPLDVMLDAEIRFRGCEKNKWFLKSSFQYFSLLSALKSQFIAILILSGDAGF